MITSDVDEVWEWMKKQKEALDREKETNARDGDVEAKIENKLPGDDAFYRPARFRRKHMPRAFGDEEAAGGFVHEGCLEEHDQRQEIECSRAELERELRQSSARRAKERRT